MEKYDSNMPVTFKTGTHKIVSDANFNFQLNRVIFWDGGDEAEVCRECTNIKTFEKRINKVIAWSIFPDFFHVVLSDHPGNVASFIEKILSSPVRNIMNGFYKKMMKQDELVRWNLLHGMYAYDAKTPMEYIARIRKFTLHGIADKITQDVLVLCAREDHFINPRLFHEEFDLLTNARSLTLRLFSEKDNAGGHCNVGNSKLVLDAMLSWLNGR